MVGKNEDTHTAQSQLVSCLEKSTKGEKITLDDLVQAFDIEKVSKEFFAKYKILYEKLCKELERLYNTDKPIFDDFNECNINIEDFAKKTLGQLVFLYFIQKKGWLGVSRDEVWGQGDKKFLRNLFNKKYAQYDNFFNDILEHLFYEALASDRGEGAWFDKLNCRIPFLNGGLFEPINKYKYEVTNLNIDNSIFKEIFDTFDLYNFTVKEDEPLEKEVAIDPEMLGKVFENLLPENIRKGNGAFYTPREIVHYMCQESLINYLYNKINIKEVELSPEEQAEQQLLFKKKKTKQMKLTQEIIEEVVSKEDISIFIKKGDSVYSNKKANENLPQSVLDNAMLIDKALEYIKICDPAIGSGAFPVGMMNEVVRARTALSEKINPNRLVYDLKRNAIENSIYGVDMDPGAVEIAKLRFWLSLVVDEENIQKISPLPNLDYKIMQGNSLITCYEGIDFDEIVENQQEMKQLGLFVSATEKITDKIRAKQHEFLNTPYTTKKCEIKQEIEDLIFELVKTSLEEKENLKANDEKIDIESKIRNFAQNKEKRNFFPWKLFFADAFEQGGFDIVIGNPPYIDSETMVNEGMQNLRDIIAHNFNWAKGNWDIYIAFFEKAYNLLTKRGNMIYITPDKWLARPFGLAMRSEIKNHLNSILFAGRNVFQSALVDSIITNINKNYVYKTLVSKFFNNKIESLNKINITNIPEPYTLDFLSSDKISLLNKIEQSNYKLSSICQCQSACATSDAYNLKSLIETSDNYDTDKYYKIINTGTIGKWYSKWSSFEIKYLKDKYKFPIVAKEKFKKSFGNSYSSKVEHPKLIIKGLTLLHSYLDDVGEYIPCKSTLIIQSDNVNDLKLIMAIIHSRLAICYISEKYSAASYNGGIAFNKNMLNDFPLPVLNNKQKEKLISVVNNIIPITITKDYQINQEKQNAVKEYEDQIDIMIYKLYDLTYEEILTIDKDCTISEDEYRNYQL